MAMKQGTIIVDATLIAPPSSTKNKAGKRDPEMRQTKKGNQWYFGMKIYAGVEKDTGLIHSVVTTAANVPPVSMVERSSRSALLSLESPVS
jgi:IS5 family transposase